MIYLDNQHAEQNGTQWNRLLADTPTELTDAGTTFRLPRHWRFGRHTPEDHFCVPENLWAKVLQYPGTISVTVEEADEIVRSKWNTTKLFARVEAARKGGRPKRKT